MAGCSVGRALEGTQAALRPAWPPIQRFALPHTWWPGPPPAIPPTAVRRATAADPPLRASPPILLANAALLESRGQAVNVSPVILDALRVAQPGSPKALRASLHVNRAAVFPKLSGACPALFMPRAR
jgi:hypothetical protein